MKAEGRRQEAEGRREAEGKISVLTNYFSHAALVQHGRKKSTIQDLNFKFTPLKEDFCY
jgi:hypothetical protein